MSINSSYNLTTIQQQFPGLEQTIHGKPLVYLDNAATTHKPQVVLNAIIQHYTYNNANVHRATHTLANKATLDLEETRETVQNFIHAKEASEIIFTSGTTASINLVANSYGNCFIEPEDEIIITQMEHHANIVPWQILCENKGAYLKVVPVNESGELILTAFEELLSSKTRIIAITYVSNTLGTINPIQEMIDKAHAVGAIVVVDAAQAAAHLPIDVQKLNCDFLAFSAHKVYGPTGVGVLYGKRNLLEIMPPYQSGGNMIKEVSLQKSVYNDIPYKFEAGTPNIANIIAFGAALEFIQAVGWHTIINHEKDLTNYAQKLLSNIEQIKFFGTSSNKIGIISFILESMHHFDVGLLLDAQGIAVRTGYGCAQPLMQKFNIDGIVRISFGLYNTIEEIDYFVKALHKIIYLA